MEEVSKPFCSQVHMSIISEKISIEGVVVNPNECFLNAHRLASVNSGMQIIEGISIGLNKDNVGHCFPHVWNKLGDLYFDITGESLLSAFPEILQIDYFPGYEYSPNEFSVGDAFEFRQETKNAAETFNDQLEKLMEEIRSKLPNAE